MEASPAKFLVIIPPSFYAAAQKGTHIFVRPGVKTKGINGFKVDLPSRYARRWFHIVGGFRGKFIGSPLGAPRTEVGFRPMPRYFFNTRIGDELISDPEGEELPNPDRAWE